MTKHWKEEKKKENCRLSLEPSRDHSAPFFVVIFFFSNLPYQVYILCDVSNKRHAERKKFQFYCPHRVCYPRPTHSPAASQQQLKTRRYSQSGRPSPSPLRFIARRLRNVLPSNVRSRNHVEPFLEGLRSSEALHLSFGVKTRGKNYSKTLFLQWRKGWSAPAGPHSRSFKTHLSVRTDIDRLYVNIQSKTLFIFTDRAVHSDSGPPTAVPVAL